jgi:hypothetical protein
MLSVLVMLAKMGGFGHSEKIFTRILFAAPQGLVSIFF